jgi:hypothetical protein
MSQARQPKKSEFLEVRLPHPTKQAFMDRCRRDGTSASEAVRGFIDGYLAGGERRPRRLIGLKLAAAGAALLAAGAVAAPSLAHPGLQQTFAQLDANGDGRISQAEFLRGAAVNAEVSLGRASRPVSLPAGARLRAIAQAFDGMDSNHDGALSLAEFRRGLAR